MSLSHPPASERPRHLPTDSHSSRGQNSPPLSFAKALPSPADLSQGLLLNRNDYYQANSLL